MATSTAFIPASSVVDAASRAALALPRNCTFAESDWRALATHWYPVAFASEVMDKPFAACLLDERVVVYRISDGSVRAAKDICFHRGAPMSMGSVEGDEIICAYHGLRYNDAGQCVCIPAHPGGAISPRLRLHMLGAQEAYGLIWVQLVEDATAKLPVLDEWNDPDYIQVLPDAVDIAAASGRQIEGFLDVAHFSFIHKESFGEEDNAFVPEYNVTTKPDGFIADYISTVSNYAHGYKHLGPPGFLWHRRFETYLPFAAKLTVFFPNGQLHILNLASPVSARKTRLFVPICRNFDKDSPLQATLDFNHQVFAEDQEIVEQQYPEDLPLDLHAEAHFPADRSSLAYRKGLAAMGLGRSFTA
ncbi:Rieske 2Fe-2S domain-containing protein [Granulicella cerasi]|uniref:Rieske 2Fe-2S domain-containing protein n=1 Tax=Granulicella cerasi TaxID=741063 RepID=A0ABW1Z7X2_9BACT|nr:aromatic ring-hydroxylating dioxygenase subunit alpha [Granulicella cerasi]